jgi:hypothetical protein
MARALAATSRQTEASYVFEFEQPAFLTLGVAYESRPRLSGGAYNSILRRIDAFLDEPIAKALAERERRGSLVLALDDAVSAVVEKLKAKGTSALWKVGDDVPRCSSSVTSPFGRALRTGLGLNPCGCFTRRRAGEPHQEVGS